ncbi:copper amine oxidase N-terminal domain-containing protein [Paenibacillus sp. KACC 21273]|uniref:copper amine oxidase N-terminal domain-containing protein n=1 Tax=Paenibacillus sp. KACC 21273 TaxID=3025665 RepID=UPI0023670E6D|nr:copper amine oxidase N-terminal domain-containing protein [Paenibacillus sp. KACC 21273]WDF50654.1 copper amine oxidase N-terminal domain-containing protein [Paenibacillus sp. KACC 21273]
MKKKICSAVLVTALTVSGGLHTPSVSAATPIKITIDGVQLTTDQAPVMSANRTMVPLRGVFEALDAKVLWKQSTKTVTATKDGTTIVLPLGSRTATINGKSVVLDVPAKSIKGRTVVPLRFVSEALGEKVGWNSSTKTVSITTTSSKPTTPTTPTTPSTSISPVPYVNTKVVGQQGNGNDLEISFPASASTKGISQYRILVVKANSNTFNINTAQNVPAANYTAIPQGSSNYTITLMPQARDTDGQLIQKNVNYRVYVLAVGATGYNNALSVSSPIVSLGVVATASAIATDVKASDVSDNGDGRDFSVTFTKASDESKLSNYRVFVVKTTSAGSFSSTEAAKVSNSNYTTINKTGSNPTTRLTNTTRDTSGELITTGTAYTVFVVSITSSGDNIGISAGSNSLTLGRTVEAPSITKVEDVSNYADGRDIQVTFTKSSEESKISGYRVFVVRSKASGDFDIATANGLASSRYIDVSKTGSDRTVTLSTSLKDSGGEAIANDVPYRIYVMALGSGSYANSLSSASSTLTLQTGTQSTGNVSGIAVSDISDYGDGRDLQVTFNKASDEGLVNNYRVMVVKSINASKFNLSTANSVSSSNYLQISKNGSNRMVTFSAGSKDVNGDLIKNGTNYQVFVLTTGTGNASGNNSLSGASSVITLAANGATSAVNTVATTNSNSTSTASDITFSFVPANDTGISEYRVYVVRADQAGSFNVNTANNVAGANYTRIAKTATKVTQALTTSTKDYNGNAIVKDVAYRVYVLSVADGSVRSVNTLSGASNDFTIKTPTVAPVTNLNATETNGGIKVTFSKPSGETGIASYAVMLVPSASSSNFSLADANRVSERNYETVTKGVYSEWTFTTADVDINGAAIRSGVAYKAFVLSIADGRVATVNALSVASREAQIIAQ